MISPLRRLASSSARRLLPAPVGPEMTITFSFLTQAVEKKRRRRVKGEEKEAARRRRGE
jgi:hypothetical protein